MPVTWRYLLEILAALGIGVLRSLPAPAGGGAAGWGGFLGSVAGHALFLVIIFLALDLVLSAVFRKRRAVDGPD